MGLNDRRSVFGINAPYRVIFPIPDGSINSSQGNDRRQVGYSYSFSPFAPAGGGGGTLYIDSATIINFLRNSPNANLSIVGESVFVNTHIINNEPQLSINSNAGLFNNYIASPNTSLNISAASNIPTKLSIESNAALLIGCLNSLFYSLKTENLGGLSSSNASSLINNWSHSSEAGINSANGAGIFSNFFSQSLGSLLLNSAIDIASVFHVNNLPSLSISNNINLLGVFNTQADSTIFGNVFAECSSALNFAVGAISAAALSSSINILTENVLGGAGGISTLNSGQATSIFALQDNPSINIGSESSVKTEFIGSNVNRLSMVNQAAITNNFVSECVPEVVGVLLAICNIGSQLRLSAAEQLLIAGTANMLSELNLTNISSTHMNSVVPLIATVHSLGLPLLNLGGAANISNNIQIDNQVKLFISSISEFVHRWETINGGGLLYTNESSLSSELKVSSTAAVFLNSIFSATANFGQQNAGGMNLISEVYFINRLATENNIRASIVGAVDIFGNFHIFTEELQINGIGNFYVADFILRRKSLTELELYRLSLSHNNLHIKQSSLKDLNLSQIRSYILSIEDAGLFEVNRRI